MQKNNKDMDNNKLERNTMQNVAKYIGLDTHKESIAVAIADAANKDVRFYGHSQYPPANRQAA